MVKRNKNKTKQLVYSEPRPFRTGEIQSVDFESTLTASEFSVVGVFSACSINDSDVLNKVQ